MPFWVTVMTAQIRGRSGNTGVEFPVALAEKEPWMCLSANFPQTKRNQDFLLEARETSDVQDHTTQPQTGLCTAGKTGSANKSPGWLRPCRWTLFFCCQIQTKLRDKSLSSSSKYKNGFMIQLSLWTHVLFHRILYHVILHFILFSIPCSLQDKTWSLDMCAYPPYTHVPAMCTTSIPPKGTGLPCLSLFCTPILLPSRRE